MKLNGLFQDIALTMCNGGSCNKNLRILSLPSNILKEFIC